jgi:hypothetical protein
MASKVTFSPTRDAVRKRISAIPRMADGAALTLRQRDANAMILNFRTGIATNSFRLTPLRQATIRQKKRKGYRKPSTPLYGLGFEGPWTYIKALKKYKMSRGYVVRFSSRRHHGGLTEEELFQVHEYGAVIRSKSGLPFRIPPRPAFTKSYEKTLRGLKDDSESVLSAAWELIQDGRSKTLARIQANGRKLEAMLGN